MRESFLAPTSAGTRSRNSRTAFQSVFFVTEIMEPNDVDCVLLITKGFPKDPAAEAELRAGLPFLDIGQADQGDFNCFVDDFSHGTA